MTLCENYLLKDEGEKYFRSDRLTLACSVAMLVWTRPSDKQKLKIISDLL